MGTLLHSFSYRSITSFCFSYTEIRGSTPDNTLGSGAVSPERGDTPVPLPQSELDSETVRSGLRDFLQELRDAQKERVMGLRGTKMKVHNNSRIISLFV